MDRRAEILQAATELIQTHGYNGFSYKDISEQIGIAKASIHHHFASKEGLGIAYCQKKFEELSAFRASISRYSQAQKKLTAYLNKPKKRLETRKMCGINAMQSDCASMSKSLREQVKKVTELDIAIVTEILQAGEVSGEFKLLTNAKDQAEMLVSALKGALQRSLLNKDESYDKVAKTILKMVAAT